MAKKKTSGLTFKKVSKKEWEEEPAYIVRRGRNEVGLIYFEVNRSQQPTHPIFETETYGDHAEIFNSAEQRQIADKMDEFAKEVMAEASTSHE